MTRVGGCRGAPRGGKGREGGVVGALGIVVVAFQLIKPRMGKGEGTLTTKQRTRARGDATTAPHRPRSDPAPSSTVRPRVARPRGNGGGWEVNAGNIEMVLPLFWPRAQTCWPPVIYMCVRVCYPGAAGGPEPDARPQCRCRSLMSVESSSSATHTRAVFSTSVYSPQRFSGSPSSRPSTAASLACSDAAAVARLLSNSPRVAWPPSTRSVMLLSATKGTPSC